MDELEHGPTARVEFDLVTQSGGDVLVTIRGELDISAVDALQARVEPLLEDGPRRLIVDVSELRFADSSAIALWVRWATAADQFELRDPSPLLRRVIAGMGLTGKLAVAP
jgi:anti-anti-sigma factor